MLLNKIANLLTLGHFFIQVRISGNEMKIYLLSIYLDIIH